MSVLLEKNMYRIYFEIEKVLEQFNIDTMLIPDEGSYVSCSVSSYLDKQRTLLCEYEIDSCHVFSAEFKHSGDPVKGNLNYFICDELGLPVINRSWPIVDIYTSKLDSSTILEQLQRDLNQVFG